MFWLINSCVFFWIPLLSGKLVIEPQVIGITVFLAEMSQGIITARMLIISFPSLFYSTYRTDDTIQVSLFHNDTRLLSHSLYASPGAICDHRSATGYGFKVYSGIVVLPG